MIEVTNLTKKYGDHLAVDNLSFTVDQGQIYGFLGPNGAGKSTTMNIMTGCLAATDGTVKMNGHDILEEPKEAKRHIGYLPELPPLYLDMTPREYLKFVCGLKNIKKEQQAQQIQEVCDKTGITDVQHRLIKHLSKGYRQRVGLAQAILGDPEILILDEPTVGLDPKQIIEMRDLIKDLGKQHTVILSSHILSEVSAICDKIMIISHGKLVACDTPDQLSNLMLGANNLAVTVRGEQSQVQLALLNIDGITGCDIMPGREEGTLELSLTSDQATDIREAVFFALAGIQCPILSMHTAQMSLEEVFLELTENQPEPTEQPADLPDQPQSGEEAASDGSNL